jgi:galactose mutarotase-like enzyme
MKKTDWHGFSAWTLETDTVSATIVPELGGKIVSLVDRVADYEWLFSPQATPQKPPYGAVFTDYSPRGWDEMFPTIVECHVPDAPAETLPDHGEVWALPWEVVGNSDDAITMRVQGQQPGYPYTLMRQARIEGNVLRLSYRLDNHADRALPFLWAAHPLFNGHSDIRIDLPSEVQSVVNVMDHPALGEIDRVMDWPTVTLVSSGEKAIDRMGDASLNDCRKFYTLPETEIGYGSLVHEGIGRTLTVRWDTQIVPYLGIWVDEGVHTPETTVALEPGSGYYDSLETAINNERVAKVAAGGTAQWWLEVELGAV